MELGEHCTVEDQCSPAVQATFTAAEFTMTRLECIGLSATHGAILGHEVWPTDLWTSCIHLKTHLGTISEIYNRGLIACGISANPLFNYESGIITNNPGDGVDHVISVIGWGQQPISLP